MERNSTQVVTPDAERTGTKRVSVADRVEELQQQWHKEEERKSLPGGLMVVSACLFCLIGIFMASTLHSLPILIVSLVLCAFLASFGVVSSVRHQDEITPVQAQVRAQLEALNDRHAIVPLLNALAWQHDNSRWVCRSLRDIIAATLARMLTDISRQEAEALLVTHGDLLVAGLNYYAARNPDFVIAGLHLLPAYPDRRGLMLVAKLVLRAAPTQNEQRVREAAQDVLKRLLAEIDLGGVASLSNWIHSLYLPGDNLPAGTNSTPYPMPNLAVMQLLPRMETADYLKLEPKLRQRLYSSLRVSKLFNGQYSMTILEMVRRSTDVDALSALHALIDGGGCTSPYPQVREATRACIPILQEQLEKERVSKSLLRGASAPEPTPDTLLRAANTVTPTDPQLLLRANVQDKSSISQ